MKADVYCDNYLKTALFDTMMRCLKTFSLCALIISALSSPLIAKEKTELVTDTFKGPWTFSHASPEEAEAYLRKYPAYYASWPSLDFADEKQDLTHESYKILRVEIKNESGKPKYSFRARAVIEVTMSRPLPEEEQLAEGISPLEDEPAPQPDPFSDEATADQLGDVMESEVAEAAAEAMNDALGDVFSNGETLMGVLQDLYSKAIVAGARGTLSRPILDYMVEVRKAIDKVKQAQSLIETMEDSAWGTTESLFDMLLEELDTLNDGPTGQAVLAIPDDATFRPARDNFVRAVNKMRTEAQQSVRKVRAEKNRQELERALNPQKDTPPATAEPQLTGVAADNEIAEDEVPQPARQRPTAASKPSTQEQSIGAQDESPGVHSIDAEEGLAGRPVNEEIGAPQVTSTNVGSTPTAKIPEKPDDKSIRLSIREHQLDYFEGELAKADAALETARAGREPQYVTIYKPHLANPDVVKKCRKDFYPTKRSMNFTCRTGLYLNPQSQKIRDFLRSKCSGFISSRHFNQEWFALPIKRYKKSSGIQFMSQLEMDVSDALTAYETELVGKRLGITGLDQVEPGYFFPKNEEVCGFLGKYENTLLAEQVPILSNARSPQQTKDILADHFSEDLEDAVITVVPQAALRAAQQNESWVRDPAPLSLYGAPVDLWPPAEMRAVTQELEAIKSALSTPEEAFEGLSEAELDAPLLGEVAERIASLQPAPVLRSTPLPQAVRPAKAPRPASTTPGTSTSTTTTRSATTGTGTGTAQVRTGTTPQSSDELFDTFFGTESAPAQAKPAPSATGEVQTDDLFKKFWD